VNQKGGRMGRDRMNKAGMSLLEVLIAATVFVVASLGILYAYAKCIELNEIGRGGTAGLEAVKNKMEEVKATPFSQIHDTYNNATFTAAGLNGIGVVYVDNTNSKLLVVKVVFCWRLLNGRVVGEDKNLNGVLNAGEDKNGNNQIDSYVQLVTEIYG
jgi:hypothetical protein